MRLRSNWSVNGKTYPAGALIATDLEAYLKGARTFDVLFEPTERKSLAAFSPTRHHVLLTELDNVRSRIFVLTHRDGRWHREPLPGASEFGELHVHAVNREDSDDYFLETTDFLTPNTLAMGTIGSGPAQTLKQLPAFFGTNGLAISQHETVSADGTPFPTSRSPARTWSRMARTRRCSMDMAVSRSRSPPSYRPTFGLGLSARQGRLRPGEHPRRRRVRSQVAPIRSKANRHKAYEDFIAVAEDLVRRKVTSPSHLGVMGRSNGGLLVRQHAHHRPDLFGVVCGSLWI